MESKHRGVRESSESPPPAPSPPSYIGSNYSSIENNLSCYKTSRGSSPSVSSHQQQQPQDKSRRKYRSGSRSSSTRSSQKRSRSRDKEKDHRERDKDRSRKHYRRDRSRSRSRGRSRSRERRRSRSRNKSRERHRYRDRRYNRQTSYESDLARDDITESTTNSRSYISAQPNAFKNDGSFMEMFKKMQEQLPSSNNQPPNLNSIASSSAASSNASVLQERTAPPPPLMVGKRRGGRILKTGMVAKPKTEPTAADQPKDAWSLYMAEVKKYREVCCQEEDNTRPLVK